MREVAWFFVVVASILMNEISVSTSKAASLICLSDYDRKSMFVFKTSSIWFSLLTHLPLFNAIFPRCLNRVSRRLKRIGEEETGCHKPYSFNLKDAADCKMRFWSLVCVVYIVTCVCAPWVQLKLAWEFRGRNSFNGGWM